jgi:hypothetical protein
LDAAGFALDPEAERGEAAIATAEAAPGVDRGVFDVPTAFTRDRLVHREALVLGKSRLGSRATSLEGVRTSGKRVLSFGRPTEAYRVLRGLKRASGVF